MRGEVTMTDLEILSDFVYQFKRFKDAARTLWLSEEDLRLMLKGNLAISRDTILAVTMLREEAEHERQRYERYRHIVEVWIRHFGDQYIRVRDIDLYAPDLRELFVAEIRSWNARKVGWFLKRFPKFFEAQDGDGCRRWRARNAHVPKSIGNL